MEAAENMNFSRIDVRELLPHGDGFVMVSSLESFSKDCVRTSFLVREDNALFDRGRLLEAGLLENVAQTAAVRNGFICKYILHIEPSAGVVCTIRDMKIFRLPSAGELLTTQITVRGELDGLLLFSAEVLSADGEVLLRGTMATSAKKTQE